MWYYVIPTKCFPNDMFLFNGFPTMFTQATFPRHYPKSPKAKQNYPKPKSHDKIHFYVKIPKYKILQKSPNKMYKNYTTDKSKYSVVIAHSRGKPEQLNIFWAVVVVKWSAYSPSIPTI